MLRLVIDAKVVPMKAMHLELGANDALPKINTKHLTCAFQFVYKYLERRL